MASSKSTESTAKINSYDETPYPSKPFDQTHPRHLATIATLFGMSPQNINQCRVLEIGCASGNNIIPMASELPDSEFVGVELSSVQSDNASKMVADLKLKNINIHHCNILDIDDSFGEFDYIIAHGIFSWVPYEVQQHILRLAKERLSKQGVAYISYNTNPGWRMRGMLRDIMLYHAKNFTDIKMRIDQSRALINFLAEATTDSKSAYAVLLRDEVEQMKRWEDNYFRHDSLEEVNDPVYFHEFMERAEEQGLQYLSEVSISSMVANNFSEEVKKTLDKVGNNIVQREQYMDFIRNRIFRQTLLCHKDITLTREINVSHAINMAMSLRCTPTTEPKLNDESELSFRLPNNSSISCSCPFTKSVAYVLGQHWPEYMGFDTLMSNVRHHVYDNSLTITDENILQRDKQIICTRILELFVRGVMDLTSYPPKLVKSIDEKPCVSPVARLQASTQSWITNCLHQPVAIDLMKRHLLPMLDGKHDLEMLKKELLKLIKNKTLLMQEDGVTIDDDEKIQEKLSTQLTAYMQHIAQNALLLPK